MSEFTSNSVDDDVTVCDDLLASDVNHLRAKIAANIDTINQLNSEIVKFDKKEERYIDNINYLDDEVKYLNKVIATLRDGLQSCGIKIENDLHAELVFFFAEAKSKADSMKIINEDGTETDVITELGKANVMIETLKKDLDKANAECKTLKENVADKNDTIHDLQAKLTVSDLKNVDLVATLEAQKNNFEERDTLMRAAIKTLESKVLRVKTSKAESSKVLKQELNDLKKKLDQSNNHGKALENDLKKEQLLSIGLRDQLEKQLETMKIYQTNKMEETDNKVQVPLLQKEIKKLRQQVADLEENQVNCSITIPSGKAYRDHLKESINKSLKPLRNENTALTSKLVVIQTELAQANDKIERGKCILSKLREERNNLLSQMAQSGITVTPIVKGCTSDDNQLMTDMNKLNVADAHTGQKNKRK